MDVKTHMPKRKRKPFIKKRTKNKIKRKLKQFWLRHNKKLYAAVLLLLFSVVPTDLKVELIQMLPTLESDTEQNTMLDEVIGTYTDDPYVILNDNMPLFTQEEYTTEAYEYFSDLDWLGRCGPAMACIGTELMPTEERGSIGQVKPSGWQTVRYDIVDGKYLYNRCHLIGYQLTGENANEKNLITGTRYMNMEGMLPFENMVAAYVKYTGRHVLYRVTPVYDGNNLLASGVTIEGYSVEDDGGGICFYVYVHNVQPGIGINYMNGESWLLENSIRYKQ